MLSRKTWKQRYLISSLYYENLSILHHSVLVACSSRVIECSEYKSARQMWLIFSLYYAYPLSFYTVNPCQLAWVWDGYREKSWFTRVKSALYLRGVRQALSNIELGHIGVLLAPNDRVSTGFWDWLFSVFCLLSGSSTPGIPLLRCSAAPSVPITEVSSSI